MKKLRNRIYLAVVILAMIAMAMPMIGKGVRAYSNSASGRAISGNVKEANALASAAAPAGPVLPAENGNPVAAAASQSSGEGQRLSREMLEKMGIPLLKGNNKTAQSIAIGQAMARRMIGKGQAVKPQSAEPTNMLASAALSTALITNVGGRSTQFDEVLTLADWNGQEQFSANHSGKVDDFSGKIPTGPTGPSEFQLTRAAISEHTIANGFPEDIFYYGDSFGNVYVNATTSLTLATPAPNVFTINLPTVLNAFGSLNSDDQVVVTGLAVSPVVDLTSFSNVNGSFASFAGLIGEVLYVTFTDTESGFRLISNGTLVRSGVLAFPVADILSAAPAPPGIVSPTGFPVQVGGAFGVAFSVFDNEAGCAVDDDGSLYFQQVDLITLGGGNIVKITSTDNSNISTGFQDRSLATDGFITLTSLHQLDPPPAGGGPAITTGPAKQVNTFTDYSGVANLFGNIEALATGPCNNVYAAVARSGEPTDPVSLQIAEGPYSTGGTALGATPTMVIRFSDVIGAFAPCTLPTLGGPEPESDRGRRGAKVKKGVKPSGDATPSPSTTTVPIVPNGATGLPIGDGVADPVPPAGGGAIPSVIPGVNNFIIFVEGDGPDIRVATGGTSPVNATKSNTLQINDGVGFQVDPTIYAGITVDREGTVYVVSGGTPEGVGNNPSPTFGEILAFPDNCPQDGRADFIDFRGATTLPNPPSAGTNTGDGLSTRTDHIFWIAPLDVVNGENDPTAIAGLNIGFELYLNRTRTADNTTELPNGATQTDDGSNGPVIFEQFDPSHQVA
ncbi:MAG TPA: hypothetical protein VLZ81_16615, partial [Blastocatellia bacterium]|nr:hypothetical protein [Blastocatellia bacterium]